MPSNSAQVLNMADSIVPTGFKACSIQFELKTISLIDAIFFFLINIWLVILHLNTIFFAS